MNTNPAVRCFPRFFARFCHSKHQFIDLYPHKMGLLLNTRKDILTNTYLQYVTSLLSFFTQIYTHRCKYTSLKEKYYTSPHCRVHLDNNPVQSFVYHNKSLSAGGIFIWFIFKHLLAQIVSQ
jgi:hypothetical protein